MLEGRGRADASLLVRRDRARPSHPPMCPRVGARQQPSRPDQAPRWTRGRRGGRAQHPHRGAARLRARWRPASRVVAVPGRPTGGRKARGGGQSPGVRLEIFEHLNWFRYIADKFKRGFLKMPFELPKLPYAFDALEPHIDARTMEIHHDKHHAAYVANANAALEKHPELGGKTVEDLLWGINTVPEDIRTVIRNNAGGHANHSIFWTIMGPGGGGNPNGRIADALKNTFGGYDAFKEQLQKAAGGQLGSGGGWLGGRRGGEPSGQGHPHPGSPHTEKKNPSPGRGGGEAAHHPKYQNKRADYVTAWFNTLNWDAINSRFGSVWA